MYLQMAKYITRGQNGSLCLSLIGKYCKTTNTGYQ